MRTPLLLTTLTVLLAACGQPTPTAAAPTPDRLLGGVELPVTTAAADLHPAATPLGDPRLTFREGDVQITRLGAASVQSAGGFDYLRAQYEVKNVGTTPFNNLTLVAVAKQGNVGGTAIKTITDFGGVTSTDQASLAVQSTALHSVTVATDGSLSLVPGATDFQAFTPAEVAGLITQNGWNNTYGPGDKPLTYGFTVSKCTTTCTRTLNAGETGVVNVALRIPKGGATGTAYNFTLNFALVNDSVSRVTRSVTPAETAAQASNRLTALGVTTGGEVMTVGAPVSSATTNRTDVSTPGLKVVSAPFVVTLAGSGTPGSADGTGAAASFNTPAGVAVDAGGNVIVADYGNNKIRRVTPAGVVTTLAGSGTAGSADGTGTAASFNSPIGVAVDTSGNVIVADAISNKIRRVTPAGVVTTLAGSGTRGSADGMGTAASFNNPSGVAVDISGNVLVAESGSNKIRKVTPAGVVTTLAGSGTAGSADGAGTAATFNSPFSAAVDASGNVIVADTSSNKIRKVTPAGVVTTLAGSGTAGSADGTGTAATFRNPWGVAVDAGGNVFLADRLNNKIRRVTPAGVVTTLAGSGNAGSDDGTGTAASFNSPLGVAVDASGNLIVAAYGNNKIRKIFMP